MKIVRVSLWLLSFLAHAFMAAGLVQVSRAQDYRAKVQGLVSDPTQALVVGAKVTLTNEKTGIAVVRETDASGHYLFDFVEPGAYTVTVAQTGFNKFFQQNLLVQVRGDVTVDALLTIGEVTETVNVSESPVAVQFNTSTMELTVDRKMLNDLPIMQRNPFTLAMLDPAVVNRYWDMAHRNPFFMWSSSQIDVGGSTAGRNDLLLDGAPLQLLTKGSYAPPMDAVQEFSVQQNSVDAEFGHSAGGTVSLSMKSGTNEFHGTAYYFGRNPKFNAVTDSVNHTPNMVRNHIWGGTLGNPIRKNKLFTFTAYEGWRTKEPLSTSKTLPTDLERQGDFSKSLNIYGGLRTIYDPWSTVFDPATGNVARTSFPGNRIPSNRMDPTSLRVLQDLQNWKPNNPGNDITGVGNYKIGYYWGINYWNFSNRTDWNISDKWRGFGRFSRVRTDLDQPNYANSPATPNDNGGLMNNRSIAGDTVYVLNASTVLNFRMSYTSYQDDYAAPDAAIGEKGLAQLWQGKPWYTPYTDNVPVIYYPRMVVGGDSYGYPYGWGYWYGHPSSYNFAGSVRKSYGRHSLKAGLEQRSYHNRSTLTNPMQFYFSSALTADTFISPDTRRSGADWATFVLGGLDSSSNAQRAAFEDLLVRYWGAFVQDDFKLNRRITLNLGLRYEYEGAPVHPRDELSRYLDLTQSIPEMQSRPPNIPTDVTTLMKTPFRFNGAAVFADSSHRGLYDVSKTLFMPRAGVAFRINDKTAFRAGYARYVTPASLNVSNTRSLAGPMWGYSAATSVAPSIAGIPGGRLSDPFPASNPLIMPVGKSRGLYTELGGNADWVDQNQRPAVNDRFNFSIQRQLPKQVHLDITYFMNRGHNLPYTLALNLSDPQLSYTYKAALSARIPNPFYNYLTPDKFPGALRNQATVTIGSLLKPYPQYGSLSQTNTAGLLNRYQALQVRAQRAFNEGYSFLLAYNYNRDKTSAFFNADDQYLGRLTLQDSNFPRHRLSIAGTYDLPFGRGQTFGAHMHPVLNGILGGWSTSSILMLNSGKFVRFGQLIATGDPRLDNPTWDRMFDTSKFQRPEPFTPRTNPWQYPGVVGPKFWNLDTTLSKMFPIKERINLEFKFEAYNLTNSYLPGDPISNIYSSWFGRANTSYQANRGREMQYTIRLLF